MKSILSLSLVAVVVVAVSSPSPLRADEASHRKAAEEMLKTTHIEKLLSSTIDQMLDAQVKANPQIAPHKEVLKKFFNKYMSWDSIKDDTISMYADAFTEDELNQITAFYQSPVGQKMIEKQPELMNKGMQLGLKRVQDNHEELIRMLKEQTEKSQNPS